MNNISIILPITDRGRGEPYLIERTIASLIDQTAPPNQFIVVEYDTGLPWPMKVAHEVFSGSPASRLGGYDWLHRPKVRLFGQALQFGLAYLNGSSDSAVVIASEEYEYDPNFIERMSAEWRARYGDIGIMYCLERELDVEGGEVAWTPHLPFDRMAALNGCTLHLPTMALNIERAVQFNIGGTLHEGVPSWDIALVMSNVGVSGVPEVLATHHWPTYLPAEAEVQSLYRRDILARAKHGLYGPDLTGA